MVKTKSSKTKKKKIEEEVNTNTPNNTLKNIRLHVSKRKAK